MTVFTRRGVLGGMVGVGAITSGCAAIPTTQDSSAQAARLYRRAMIINGNLVAPLDSEAHLDKETSDLVRASGVTALKMTIGGSGNQSRAEVIETITGFDQAIAVNADLYIKVTSIADLGRAKTARRTGIIYSFEAAEMLEGEVGSIDQFRDLGVLVMGLSYNKTTPFASGVLSPVTTGLTELGHQAVARMNARSVSIDVSHSDELSSLGAIAASSKPILITHAGCSAVHPHPRNKSDRLMRALVDRGGVMGIYELSYLRDPTAQPSLDDYFAHLLHALNICGEDHVGIGSDTLLTPFDTSPESMALWNAEIERRRVSGVGAPGEGPPPFVTGLNRPDRCEIIADGLLARGYSTQAVEKILGGNFQRVFSETWT